MGIERVFLDWNEPALPAAVVELTKRYSVNGVLDLSNVIVVFPGRQAGRRFMELLADHSEGRAIPPRIITVGTLPEFLYEPQKPFASPLTQKLAWAEALRSLEQERLEVVIPQPPKHYDVDAWLSLGELLSRQHRELSADQLSFANVAEDGVALEGFNEQERWEVLAEVQQLYLDRLDDLQLWDQQTARLSAIEFKECQSDCDIVLVGTVDLNRTLQAMLEQVVERVRLFIHAPAELGNHFEKFGNLSPPAWEDRHIDVQDSQIQVVDGPQEQAEQVAMELAACAQEYSIDEITIGVPDDRIVPYIQRKLTSRDVASYWVIAQKLPDTGPYRLLVAVANYLEADRTDHFSELIRHPDLSAWLNLQGLPVDWLTCWDENVADHLQRRTAKVYGNRKNGKISRLLVKNVRDLLTPLRGSSRPLSDWVGPIREFLLTIYGDAELDPELDAHRFLIQASKAIHSSSLEHGSVPEALAPVVMAQQAISLTLEQIRGDFLAASSDENAVPLSGWLDLPLDDAPVAIITSMNEGYVPSAVNHDLFLPNRLRTHLKIEDNQRRYARDAYAMSVLLHSRKHVRLIAAKHDVRKEPLTPSRLLFATDPTTIAKRVVKFFDLPEKSVTSHNAEIETAGDKIDFTIPRPKKLTEPRRSFRVTEFKDYLTSPYRYYLRHILNLNGLSDSVVELDPAGFGSLIHDVLQAFGLSDQTTQTDPIPIARFLNEELDRIVDKRYGTDPLFPVHIQVEQIRHRLNIFSQWQAQWVRQGWDIRFTEIGTRKNVDFPLDNGTSITIRGRIDRIDFNERLNEWIIFDYKTGDKATPPDKTHRFKDEWIDLQLPLYRHLAKPFGVTGKVRLGYITLPRTTTQIRDQIADWTEEQLLEADQVAKETAQKIIDQQFWIELDKPVRWFQEYSGICQDGVFGREAVV